MVTNEDGLTLKEWLLRVEDKIDKVTDDHEIRIRALERWKWGLPVSMLAAAGAALVTLLHGAPPG